MIQGYQASILRCPMPAAPTILPDPTRLHLLHLSADAQSSTATVITTPMSACCPQCGQPSARTELL